METTIQGIQMIGTQRSGSNLLRVMLDAIGDIAAPHPPHILQRFLPLLPHYGDLSDDRHFHQLAADVCELVNINPVPWEGVRMDTDEVLALCRQHTLYELFRVIYESAARQRGASYWLCKSMKNVFYADGIESTGIRPYYLYLYRDGRDVALSFQKAIVGEKHIYALAKSWAADQAEALRLKARCPEDRFFSLSYEELTTRTEEIMRRLCAFLRVPYTDRMMEFYNSRESRNTADAGRMWQNVTQPVMRNNSGKFLKEMSADDLALFESVAGHELRQLGYALHTPEERLISNFTEEQIAAFARQNEELKRQFKQQMDPADLEKRRRQAELIERIRQRPL
ncbi:MAG: sulfotransferase [Bacteroidales bacterium]|nr:sulfotransferase [Bacteroidales bacterium]